MHVTTYDSKDIHWSYRALLRIRISVSYVVTCVALAGCGMRYRRTVDAECCCSSECACVFHMLHR